MFVDKRVDMAHALLFKYLVNSNQDACFLNIAKAIVDGGAKKLHGGRQAHVGINQRRNVVAQLTYLAVQDAIVGLEVVFAKQLLQFGLRRFNLQRLMGMMRFSLSSKCFFKKKRIMSLPLRIYEGYMVILPKKYFTLGLITVRAPKPSPDFVIASPKNLHQIV